MSKTIPFDVDVLKAFTASCIKAGVKYSWGGKIPHDGVPGKDFTGTDCSGFVDEAVWLSSGRNYDLPAGSWAKEEKIKADGFEVSSASDAKKSDGVVRIAFLPSINGAARHVVLILDGMTYESHGGRGVNMRAWANLPWASKCAVYVLARPRKADPKPVVQQIEAFVQSTQIRARLVLNDPAPVALLDVKAMQNAGLLKIAALKKDAVEVLFNGANLPQNLGLTTLEGVGYVAARPIADGMNRTLSWDNVVKRVTIT